MVLIITLFFTLLLVATFVGLLLYLRQPSYRPQREQVLRLFDDLHADRLKHRDWLVFISVPLRHDPWLETLRLRCMDIEEQHLLGDGSRHLFDATGREKLAQLREELQDALNQSR